MSHIASDNLGGGRQAAEALIEVLGEAGGKVVILDYKDAESCLLRKTIIPTSKSGSLGQHHSARSI